MRPYVIMAIISLALGVACREPKPPPSVPVRDGVLKVEIAQDGFYRLTADQLDIPPEALTATNIALSYQETAVPFTLADNALIFYGQAPDSRYTAVRPYILEVGQVGEAMRQTAVPPTSNAAITHIPITLHLEENHVYEATALTTLSAEQQNVATSDLWFWQKLDLANKTLTIPLDLPQVSDGSAMMTISLWGESSNPGVVNDHDLDLVINGQRIDIIQWDGNQFHTQQITIPAGTLQAGTNEILLDNSVAGASFLDTMHLNWLEITYLSPPQAHDDMLTFSHTTGLVTLTNFSQAPLIFDTQNPASPTLLTGWQMSDAGIEIEVDETMVVTAVSPHATLAPQNIVPVRQSDWHTPDNQADLLIITTDALAPPLEPLIEMREAQGLTVALIPVTEIYDAFGGGEASPNSITNFIRYAIQNWQEPAPRYLFIVGDASSDFRNYLGQEQTNFIPSPMVPVQFSGETVSDARLADVDGDMRPDLAIGRWPVTTIKEVEALVARTLAYEEGTAVNRTIFATDSTEAQFATIAQRLSDSSHLTSDFYDGSSAAEITAQINEGAWLTTYIGHGSVAQWGREGIFNLSAVDGLNGDTPPIMLQLTCLTGLFAHPELTSLSETMLRHKQGPVLIIAATSLTLSSHQEPFALNLLQSLQDPTITRIGDALQAAKHDLDTSNNGLREISDTFILLGDPSANILRPDGLNDTQ